MDVVGRRVFIVSRVSGFQGSRVNGSQGLNGFKWTKNLKVSGFQGIEGLPRLTGAFSGLVFPKSNGFRVQGIKGFLGLQGPRVKGIKGFWVPVNPKVSKVPRA